MKRKISLLTGICLGSLIAIAGCDSGTNTGSGSGLTRDLAKSLIEAELIPIESVKLEKSAQDRVFDCLDEIGVKQANTYRATEAGKELGLEVDYRKGTELTPKDSNSVGIKVTGIKPAPVSGGETEEYKIAVFSYDTSDPDIAKVLACFGDHEALFILYDDGWRLEKTTQKG